MKRKIIIGLVFVFIVIQFIPVELNQGEKGGKDDFIAVENPPTEIAHLLKTSCYDCHSNYTKYPWYDRVAPVSFWVAGHVDHAKEELNFSEWATFTEKRKNHKLKEIIEELEEGNMPLKSYLIMHGDTKVTPEQFEQLKSFINTIKD